MVRYDGNDEVEYYDGDILGAANVYTHAFCG